jgi:hypothetical protein
MDFKKKYLKYKYKYLELKKKELSGGQIKDDIDPNIHLHWKKLLTISNNLESSRNGRHIHINEYLKKNPGAIVSNDMSNNSCGIAALIVMNMFDLKYDAEIKKPIPKESTDENILDSILSPFNEILSPIGDILFSPNENKRNFSKETKDWIKNRDKSLVKFDQFKLEWIAREDNEMDSFYLLEYKNPRDHVLILHVHKQKLFLYQSFIPTVSTNIHGKNGYFLHEYYNAEHKLSNGKILKKENTFEINIQLFFKLMDQPMNFDEISNLPIGELYQYTEDDQIKKYSDSFKRFVLNKLSHKVNYWKDGIKIFKLKKQI